MQRTEGTVQKLSLHAATAQHAHVCVRCGPLHTESACHYKSHWCESSCMSTMVTTRKFEDREPMRREDDGGGRTSSLALWGWVREPHHFVHHVLNLVRVGDLWQPDPFLLHLLSLLLRTSGRHFGRDKNGKRQHNNHHQSQASIRACHVRGGVRLFSLLHASFCVRFATPSVKRARANLGEKIICKVGRKGNRNSCGNPHHRCTRMHSYATPQVHAHNLTSENANVHGAVMRTGQDCESVKSTIPFHVSKLGY